MQDTKTTDISKIKQLRDELKVQAHLGKLEARDALRRLEAALPDIESLADKAIAEVTPALRSVVDEAKAALEKLTPKKPADKSPPAKAGK